MAKLTMPPKRRFQSPPKSPSKPPKRRAFLVPMMDADYKKDRSKPRK